VRARFSSWITNWSVSLIWSGGCLGGFGRGLYGSCFGRRCLVLLSNFGNQPIPIFHDVILAGALSPFPLPELVVIESNPLKQALVQSAEFRLSANRQCAH
jgi:hypothetical protein